MVLSKKLKIVLIISCILGASLCISLITFFPSNDLSRNQNSTIKESSQIILEDDPPVKTENYEPSIPNITATLDNIDTFIAGNLTAFVGNQTISDFGYLRHVRIVLDWIYIYDDQDPFDVGEIYVETCSMLYYSGDSLVYDHVIQRIYIADLSDEDNYTTDIVLFDGWVWFSSIIIRIFDEDTMDPDDLLGYYWKFYNNSNWYVKSNLIYDRYNYGYARIGIFQQNLGSRQTTASDVVNLMRPYLFTDVETSMGLNFEKVYGRVVSGTDSLLNSNVYCIQYYFYWSAEYTCLDSFVHYWDYEPMYFFIDPWTDIQPYRIVFDNGFYWSGNPAGDEQWWKCHDYTIYEDLTLTGQTAGTQLRKINFTSELIPLIGDSNQMQFSVKSINEIFDSAFANWVYGIGGVNTPVITIETSYHSFDKGDPDGGYLWAFDYSVDDLTDNVIYTWFNRINTSFYGGTHDVDGVATPYYSPFCYDIMNPFQRPYISNNFDKLLSDIIAFNNAKESESFSFDIISDIKARLIVPIDATITTPKSLGPNQTFTPNINIKIDISKAILAIDYKLGFSIAVDWWFWEGTYEFIKNGTIYIDFSNPILQLIATYIEALDGFHGFYSPTDFIEIEMLFTPQLLGTIINATISFKIMEIVYTFLPTLRPLLSLFIDDFNFVINPVLEGFLNMDYWTTGSSHSHFTFNELSINFSPNITSPLDNSNFSIYIGNFSYGWRFYTNWGLEIDFTSLLEIFFSDIYINLFTYPDITMILFSISQDITICSYEWNPSTEKYSLK